MPFLRSVAGALKYRFRRYILRDKQLIALEKWHNDDGDHRLRHEYPLTDNSLVLDLGGYKGQWSSDIFSRYRCKIHVFEPVPIYHSEISKRFAQNPSITTHCFGLASTTRTVQFTLAASGTSMFRPGSECVQARLVSVKEFFESNRIDRVDLMKVNIEGGEYELLDCLLTTALISRIRDLQIQFHRFSATDEAAVRKFRSQLEKTHRLTYCYDFVWENWTRLL